MSLVWNHLHCQALAVTPQSAASLQQGDLMGWTADSHGSSREKKSPAFSPTHNTPCTQRRMSVAAKAAKWERSRCKWSKVRGR